MMNINTYGSDDVPFKEAPLAEENRRLKQYIGRLEHDMFFLYVFLTANNSCDDACEFLECHEEDRIPFRPGF